MTVEDLRQILSERIQITDRRLQILILVTGLALLLTCIILAILVGVQGSGMLVPGGSRWAESLKQSPRPCVTSSCLELAADMADKMDISVSPCEDFHKFACGGWQKVTSIPPDHEEVTIVGRMTDRNQERIREILEQPVKRTERKSAERKVKELFRMCVHDYGRLKDGGRTLVRLVRDTLAGVYLLDPDNWNSGGSWSLAEAMAAVVGDQNIPILVKFYVAKVWRDGSFVPLVRQLCVCGGGGGG